MRHGIYGGRQLGVDEANDATTGAGGRGCPVDERIASTATCFGGRHGEPPRLAPADPSWLGPVETGLVFPGEDDPGSETDSAESSDEAGGEEDEEEEKDEDDEEIVSADPAKWPEMPPEEHIARAREFGVGAEQPLKVHAELREAMDMHVEHGSSLPAVQSGRLAAWRRVARELEPLRRRWIRDAPRQVRRVMRKVHLPLLERMAA